MHTAVGIRAYSPLPGPEHALSTLMGFHTPAQQSSTAPHRPWTCVAVMALHTCVATARGRSHAVLLIGRAKCSQRIIRDSADEIKCFKGLQRMAASPLIHDIPEADWERVLVRDAREIIFVSCVSSQYAW
jgi:hypothetical protein